jgi:hypothetical protein
MKNKLTPLSTLARQLVTQAGLEVYMVWNDQTSPHRRRVKVMLFQEHPTERQYQHMLHAAPRLFRGRGFSELLYRNAPYSLLDVRGAKYVNIYFDI